MTVLPAGVSSGDFEKALHEFQAAVGAQWVFSSPDDMDLYRDAYSIVWGEAQERRASAAVAPANVEEVQAVVRIANKHKIPVYAISTGRNLTYGGSAPNYTGCVVIDLKRMNKIIEVNDKRNFAVVEPGVTYFDLFRHIQDKGLKVWIDCPDPGWGSVMGNALDHGVGYTYSQYRDHFGAHCGMEVVLANGEVMRTGMGALPNSNSWQDFRYGYGPYLDGLFAQGNFGIVTKMGFWMMPQPESYLSGTIMVPRYRDLIPLVEQVNYLEDSGLITPPGYFSPAGGGMFAPPDPKIKEMLVQGWPSEDTLDAFAKAKNAPCWAANVAMLGPAAALQGTWAFIKQRVAAAIPGATFKDGDSLNFPLTPEQQSHFPHRVAVGIPNMEVYSLVARSPINNPADPPFGHADFTCVISRTGESVFEAQRAFYEAFTAYGLPSQINPFSPALTWHQRTFIMGPIIWTYRDAERNKKARALFDHLIDMAASHGWAEYRTAPVFQDKLAAQFSFNDHALMKFTEALKDAADPNGILSPGRGGVWPKHLRASQKGKPYL